MSHTLKPIVDNSYSLSNEEIGETHQMRTITNNSSRKKSTATSKAAMPPTDDCQLLSRP